MPSISAKEAASSSIAGDASGVGLFGGLAKALSFLPALGLLRIGKGGLSSAFDGLKQLGADFLFRDVTSLFADLWISRWWL